MSLRQQKGSLFCGRNTIILNTHVGAMGWNVMNLVLVKGIEISDQKKKMNLCLMKQTFSSEIWLEGVEVTHLDFITRNKDQLNALS